MELEVSYDREEVLLHVGIPFNIMVDESDEMHLRLRLAEVRDSLYPSHPPMQWTSFAAGAHLEGVLYVSAFRRAARTLSFGTTQTTTTTTSLVRSTSRRSSTRRTSSWQRTTG